MAARKVLMRVPGEKIMREVPAQDPVIIGPHGEHLCQCGAPVAEGQSSVCKSHIRTG